ncbi:hypothetical protein LTR24_001304 [Lithohypha guttulata]|uniref:NDT80 domain-containing protein n=1 Tax=Lithohypha guttulata TaxID=1690604 RepID=A0ABR0KL75_9EURO|nr:hypothetical protein LTR24_001304 [Lithohypha guttulata]
MSATSNADPLDQYSNFDSETYASGDEMSYAHGGGLAHQAMLKRMSSSFEDPFAHETISQFDQMAGADGIPDSPSMGRDSKYLSFSMPGFPYRLYNESFQQCYVNIQAQLHGMFFLAESQWPTTMDTAPPPPELTCYRRNLFQIIGNVTIPRSLRYIFTEDGRRLPIYDMELHVSATESVEGNPVKIISVPWKTSSGAEPAKQDEKTEKDPPTIELDKLAGADMDSDFNTIPVQWKRLQFRIATANNGRRKELQQHFTLHLKVMATVSTGEKMSISESHSGAVIVRGRSPRNFAARKDVPLSSSSTSRKHVPTLSRSGESTASIQQITSAPKQSSPNEQILRSHPVFDSGDLQRPEVDLNGWQQAVSPFPEPSTTPYSQSMLMNPPAPMAFTGAPSPDIAQTPFGFAFSPDLGQNISAPISLHFASDDEGSNSPYPQQQSSRTSSRPPTSNPSPLLMNKPRSTTYAHATSPQNITSEPPSKQRTRLHSHNASAPTSNGAMSASAPPMSTGVGVQFDQHPHHPSHPQRPPLPQTLSHISHQSNDGANVNGLYEYFPLSIDEWQPPVDAVFRPHVVHHEIALDSSMRSPGVMSGRSSKRYFSEVM